MCDLTLHQGITLQVLVTVPLSARLNGHPILAGSPVPTDDLVRVIGRTFCLPAPLPPAPPVHGQCLPPAPSHSWVPTSSFPPYFLPPSLPHRAIPQTTLPLRPPLLPPHSPRNQMFSPPTAPRPLPPPATHFAPLDARFSSDVLSMLLLTPLTAHGGIDMSCPIHTLWRGVKVRKCRYLTIVAGFLMTSCGRVPVHMPDVCIASLDLALIWLCVRSLLLQCRFFYGGSSWWGLVWSR